MTPIDADILRRANQLLLRCQEIARTGDTHLLQEQKGHLRMAYNNLRVLAHSNSDAARLLWQFPLVLGIWAMPVLGNELICCNRIGEKAARRIRDRTEAGEVLIALNYNLAALYFHRGSLVKSADRLRIASWIAGDLGRKAWQGRIFGELGEVLMQMGDLTEAELWMKDSLSAARSEADAEAEILARFRLLQLRRVKGDYVGALVPMEALLRQVQSSGSTASLAAWKVLVELSILCRESGNLQLAEMHLQRALALSEKDLVAQECIYQGLSIIAMQRRDLTLAQEYRECAVQINRVLPKNGKISAQPIYGVEDRLTTARLQLGQGAWHFAQGYTEHACEDFRSALVSFRKSGDSAGECEALYSLALAEFRLCHFEEAIARALEAFDSARVLGHPLFQNTKALLDQIRSAQHR